MGGGGLNNFPHYTFAKAFTLAEVLITLGIIGIVTAMTLPALIANHNKKVIETRLKSFYSTMNQAIVRAEVDLGDKKYWFMNLSNDCKADEYSETCLRSFYDIYLKKYLNAPKTFYTVEYNDLISKKGSLWIYFSNGSGVKMGYSGRDYAFFPVASKMDKDNRTKCKDYFIFALYPNASEKTQIRAIAFKNKGLEPYINTDWDGTREWLVQHKQCSKLIQLNNWEIPEDYPVKL